ncbi:MAG: DUF1778 domain-containing protein [Hyphomicrobiales bacterium]|nr:DUF1778 domain-containing protein [Hyphomicrobiales bacterium]
MPLARSDNGRIELWLRPEDKAMLTHAASLRRLDLTGCILGAVLPEAEADIAEAARFTMWLPRLIAVCALISDYVPTKAREGRP